jgi:DNA-binding MarR family transcriptional regulator
MVFDSAATLTRTLRRFFRLENNGADLQSAMPDATREMVQLMAVLLERESAGQETSLRQLHIVANLPQPISLRAARALEEAELVAIEADHTDAFASTVRPTRAAQRRFGKASSPSEA